MMGMYDYIEHSGDTLPLSSVPETQRWWHEPPRQHVNLGYVQPIMWAQEGRYGWISKEQVLNMIRRQIDLTKQQKGYAKDKPIDLAFHWDDTTPLNPATVKLMRETS